MSAGPCSAKAQFAVPPAVVAQIDAETHSCYSQDVFVIRVQGLRKRFRRLTKQVPALDGLSFSVPEGGVYGFLGPNGSGKTTTIRCLLKLIRPSAGRIEVLGAPPSRLAVVLKRVGAIVETPTFFPEFSALQNLSHLGSLLGKSRQQAVSVLERVGLSGREHDLVRTYSLGMKGRLALASVLLKDPDLLILDEPAHGLDPSGIRDTRLLLRELADEGRTVFLSSHLLTEVETICERVAIINRGKCVREGSVSDLIDELGVSNVVISADDPDGAVAILRSKGYEPWLDGPEVRLALTGGSSKSLNYLLSQNGVTPNEIRVERASLEDAYSTLLANSS